VGRILPALLVVIAVTLGAPLALPRRADNFVSMRQFHLLLDPAREAVAAGPLREFYARLGETPASSLRILEAPYHPLRSHRFESYQALHRQRVAVGLAAGPCALPGGLAPSLPPELAAGLSGLVPLDDARAIRAGAVDLIVLHRRMGDELPHVADSVWRRFDADRCATFLEQALAIRPRRTAELYVFDLTGRLPAGAPPS